MPTLVEYQVNPLPRKAGDNASQAHYACDSTHVPHGYSLANAITVTLVSYVVPVFLIFFNYIRVSMFVWKKGKQVNAAPNSARNQNFQLFRNRIRIIKLLIVVAVVFAVSWLPFFITLLYAVRNCDVVMFEVQIKLLKMFEALLSPVHRIIVFFHYHIIAT
ncbi:hypothetical protein DPMN_126404 [Dreissena polymorpha]|uniref:G-protein coupled receptors family 1 profile domain-containing protein n=1 Tax=Dreissena polymorpha TaxID=45954 RepID=A0A9D4H3A3_DREPO|nr:hypothetical protein DPMN_126404 [Dreissena polymorpha]